MIQGTVSKLSDALRDRYVLELGRGGMATVYLAHDLRNDRRVALKVLHAWIFTGPLQLMRKSTPHA